MNLWIAAAFVVIASVVALVALGNRKMAKAHARFTPTDVENALAELLDADAPNHDAFDLFLAFPIENPYLESVRVECMRICRECPPAPGKDINDEGERRIAALLAELRDRM